MTAAPFAGSWLTARGGATAWLTSSVNMSQGVDSEDVVITQLHLAIDLISGTAGKPIRVGNGPVAMAIA